MSADDLKKRSREARAEMSRYQSLQFKDGNFTHHCNMARIHRERMAQYDRKLGELLREGKYA